MKKEISLDSLDELFSLYGYEVNKEDDESRAYLLRQGMYFGAEIFSKNGNGTKISTKYKDAEFSCKIQNFSCIEEAENYLFKGFFQTSLTESKIKEKYKQFTENQIRQYKSTKTNIQYEYINVPYHIYDISNVIDFISTGNIVDDINKIIKSKGAYLIIVEAAAGFGKTCTAFELYNSFKQYWESKRPLFTELFRNRTQKLFKYVLRDEIEQEYKYGINTDLVIHNIKKGRIPFIIDGFDELLMKDIDKGESKEISEFEEVETMLSTIGDMLCDNAKIILTSRKTAIFAGEDFTQWVEKYNDSFKVIRFQIEEPQLYHWLTKEKMDLISSYNGYVPMSYILNPVLLTYLKNIDIETFESEMRTPEKLTDNYFKFLLERERERQHFTITVDDQKEIFKNLAKDFYSSNINYDEREFIKLCINEDNQDKLIDYSENGSQSVEELVDTLANHALLDRTLKKNKEYIGFINDFIFGYFLGSYLIEDGAKLLFNQKNINDNQLEKVFESIKYCDKGKREKLWDILNEYKEVFSQKIKISMDKNLRGQILGRFNNEAIISYEFNNITFKGNVSFKNVTFTDTQFSNCEFEKKVFDNTFFIGCTFSDCKLISNSNNQVHCYGCEDFNSGFVNDFQSKTEICIEDDSCKNGKDIEKKLLSRYFKVDNKSFKMKLVSTIKDDFVDSELDNVYKIFHQLKKKGYIKQNGNNSHITTEGSTYYHKNFGNE